MALYRSDCSRGSAAVLGLKSPVGLEASTVRPPSISTIAATMGMTALVPRTASITECTGTTVPRMVVRRCSASWITPIRDRAIACFLLPDWLVDVGVHCGPQMMGRSKHPCAVGDLAPAVDGGTVVGRGNHPRDSFALKLSVEINVLRYCQRPGPDWLIHPRSAPGPTFSIRGSPLAERSHAHTAACCRLCGGFGSATERAPGSSGCAPEKLRGLTDTRIGPRRCARLVPASTRDSCGDRGDRASTFEPR